ncbi:uncharacterized protein LOC135224020 [Macrobrachium nipponense]|uniref:uncharacterized protein LOC135224020 n=1 Tax=Macrobrachium nipponense TaxID=159736 RepID=UPI0030C7B2E5
MGIQKVTIIPYRPEANWLCERVSRKVLEALRKTVGGNDENWDRYVNVVRQQLRAAIPLESSNNRRPYVSVTAIKCILARNMEKPSMDKRMRRLFCPSLLRHLINYFRVHPITDWNRQVKDLAPVNTTPRPPTTAVVPSPTPCTPTPYDFKGADQEDPKLIEYIQRELLIPPSVQPYKLGRPDLDHLSQFNQSKIANEMLKGMKGGFFIEVGAADGESLSNSIFFERQLGWRGLLIEASPGYFEALKNKNRNAYIIHAALSVNNYASEVTFQANLGYGSKLGNTGVKVKGIPLFSILRALDVKIVDFMSLDIESFEVKVLKTVPWDKIKFRLMCIEVAHIPEGKEFLTKFLQEKGYKFLGYGYLDIDAWYALPELLNTNVNPW